MTAPTLADAGFTEAAQTEVTHEHAARVAACIDADPVVLEAGALPTLWHWTCFLPLVPPARQTRSGRWQHEPFLSNRLLLGYRGGWIVWVAPELRARNGR